MNPISCSRELLLCFTILLQTLHAEKNRSGGRDGEEHHRRVPRSVDLCGSVYKSSPVQFILYKKGKWVHTAHDDDEGKIFNGLLNSKHEVVFIVHGFQNGCNKEFVKSNMKAYFESRPDVQVVTVCYESAKVSSLLFPWTRFSLSCVASKIKTVMTRVNRELKVKWKDMTLIGHSFGGQVVGAAGNMLGGKLIWLIALDAVAFSFELDPQLSPRSAQNVIVVHTNGYPLGLTKPSGTADFYINGGKKQPGCNFLTDISEMCSHRRSFRIFKNVILNGTSYKAQKCDSYDDFVSNKCADNPTTYLSPKVTARGSFYFDTEGFPPFKQIGRPN